MPPAPQAQYRSRLAAAIDEYRPSRVLDVGAGDGALLRAMALRGYRVQGVEPDERLVERLSRDGLPALKARAEKLPFDAGSFDLVVFSYTAHHIEDWTGALAEALRVAQRAVLILDPWYDSSIPSQAVALAFDRWCKAIDRASGWFHGDCMSAAQLAGIAVKPGHGESRLTSAVKVDCLLELHELGVDALAHAAELHLHAARDAEAWRPQMNEFLERARTSGYSDDGAILVRVDK